MPRSGCDLSVPTWMAELPSNEADLLHFNSLYSLFLSLWTAAHVPLHPLASNGVCLAWNYEAALSVIYAHRCVVCVLAGHLHDGAYCLDCHGVHHLTLEGVIETPPDSNAFATVYVYEDKMVLKGRGRIPDRVMHF